jgi:hypothetical protein
MSLAIVQADLVEDDKYEPEALNYISGLLELIAKIILWLLETELTIMHWLFQTGRYDRLVRYFSGLVNVHSQLHVEHVGVEVMRAWRTRSDEAICSGHGKVPGLGIDYLYVQSRRFWRDGLV